MGFMELQMIGLIPLCLFVIGMYLINGYESVLIAINLDMFEDPFYFYYI